MKEPTPTTQTRAGEIDEALRKSHPGSAPDVREMIIEALKVVKVIP